MDTQTELTDEERSIKEYAEAQLEELGISTTIFTSYDGGYEDPDILEAIIIAYRGEEIPIELKQKILDKQLGQLDSES